MLIKIGIKSAEASCQFLAALQKDSYLNSSWLAEHAEGFSELACSIFVAPHVGARIVGCSNISPLAHGLKKQKKIIQACIRNGINITAQKTCDSLKTIFHDIGDLLKTENLKPAFAGISNKVSLSNASHKTRRSAETKVNTKSTRVIKNLSDKIRNIGNNILDDMEKIGGHTLRDHVAQTQQDLIKRAMQNNVNAATSFFNKKIASEAVQANLRNNADQITEWLTNNAKNLTATKIFEYNHGHEIGKGVLGGKKGGFGTSTTSRIVIRPNPESPLGFIVTSSFPIFN